MLVTIDMGATHQRHPEPTIGDEQHEHGGGAGVVGNIDSEAPPVRVWTERRTRGETGPITGQPFRKSLHSGITGHPLNLVMPRRTAAGLDRGGIATSIHADP